MKTIFVTYAVKEEFIPLKANGCNIIHIYTGVGKTKSTFSLTKCICKNKPDLVLNIGTAGTLKHNIGDIFIANHFIDRDYEAIKLPGIEYDINGVELLNGYLALKNWVSQYLKQGICSTGDTFITEAMLFNGDIIDMEAYAQAYVCKELNIPFLSVKYITDIIGKNSIEEWESKLTEACTKLLSWFESNNVLDILNS